MLRLQAIDTPFINIIKAREIVDDRCNIAIAPDAALLHSTIQVNGTILLNLWLFGRAICVAEVIDVLVLFVVDVDLAHFVEFFYWGEDVLGLIVF